MSTAMGRKRTGIWGVFSVRNPVGKAVGLTLAVGALIGCWEWSRYTLGPVGWADKGLYVHTGWDAIVNPLLRSVPLLRLGQDEPYPVIVERAAGWPLYTNEAKAAGRPWQVIRTDVSPKMLHQYLRAYVYGGSFWRRLWPVWLIWPLLAISCCVGGQIVDMRRLRTARNTGVYLRGNRLVDEAGWNRRANQSASV